MSSKTILITGGAGYIGSVLVKEFIEKGHNIIVLDTLRRGDVGIKKYYENDHFDFIHADYRSYYLPMVLHEHKPDIVIHLAAIVGDKDCNEHMDDATEINTEGIRYVCDEVNKLGCPLLFASTCSVYGSNPNTCTEETLVFPISHYAKTKIEMEYSIRKYSNNAFIFRFGTMYGWSPNMRFDLVINRLVHDAINTKDHIFKIFGGKQARPFLHPRDLASFVLTLLDKDVQIFNGEVFNLVSENLSMIELGELIERCIPISKMQIVPETQVERTYICRSYKAYRDLGFSPKIRVRDGIEEILKELMKKECKDKKIKIEE